MSWPNDAYHEAAGAHATRKGYKNAYLLAPNYQAGKDSLAGFKRHFKGKIGAEVRKDVPWIPLYQLPNLTAWRSDQLGGPIGDWTATTYGGFSNMYDWFLLG